VNPAAAFHQKAEHAPFAQFPQHGSEIKFVPAAGDRYGLGAHVFHPFAPPARRVRLAEQHDRARRSITKNSRRFRRFQLRIEDDLYQRLAFGNGSPVGQLRVVGQNRTGADKDRIGAQPQPAVPNSLLSGELMDRPSGFPVPILPSRDMPALETTSGRPVVMWQAKDSMSSPGLFFHEPRVHAYAGGPQHSRCRVPRLRVRIGPRGDNPADLRLYQPVHAGGSPA